MCILYNFLVVERNLFKRALLLDHIFVLNKITLTPLVHRVLCPHEDTICDVISGSCAATSLWCFADSVQVLHGGREHHTVCGGTGGEGCRE